MKIDVTFLSLDFSKNTMSGKDYSQSTSNFESFRKENKSNWHFDPSIESNDYDDFYKKIELEENNIIRKKKKDHYLLFLNFTLLSLILIITALIIKKYK